MGYILDSLIYLSILLVFLFAVYCATTDYPRKQLEKTSKAVAEKLFDKF